MPRKLASIKRISALMPIKGKDRILLAEVDGWNVIVKKDEFQVGDLCVYIEIDSVLPETEQFEFLRSKKFRIKTMKMGGVISQGIVFPLSILPQGDYQPEQDVTDILGVRQYGETMDVEPEDDTAKYSGKYPAFLMKMKWFRNLVKAEEGSDEFPDFINKTDEIRIQNAPFYLKIKGPWVATEKIDGQSGTFFLKKGSRKRFLLFPSYEFGVCSRNRRLRHPDSSTYWYNAKKYEIEKILKKSIGTMEYLVIQGECIGPRVQKNKYNVKAPDLYVFNVITPQGRMGSEEAAQWCAQRGLKFVPVISTEYFMPDSVQKVLDDAHGPSRIGDTIREGIVFRSKDGKQSFKAVDPLFLLKYDE